jgi:hypothetical protein
VEEVFAEVRGQPQATVVVEPYVPQIGIAVSQLHPAQRLVGHAPPLPPSTTSQTAVAHRATPSTCPRRKPAASGRATSGGVSVHPPVGHHLGVALSMFGAPKTTISAPSDPASSSMSRVFGSSKPIKKSRRADSRTADLLQLRVMHQALQGFSRGCKPCISKPFSLLRLAQCCTVLRSRWYQSGVIVVLVSAWHGCPYQAPFGSHRASPTSCH